MKWLIGGFALLLAVIFVAADSGRLPGFVVALYAYPGGDKVGHFALVGALGFLVNFSLLSHSNGRFARPVLLGNLAVASAIALEEVSQRLFGARTFSLVDLGSSYAGLATSAILAWLANRRRGLDAGAQPD